MSEKHFLEKGDTFKHDWISLYGTKQESQMMIGKIMRALDDVQNNDLILTRLICEVSYYNPKEIKNEQELSILSEKYKWELIGFLEGSAVNQNISAAPMNEEDTKKFLLHLKRMINNAFDTSNLKEYLGKYDFINHDFNNIEEEINFINLLLQNNDINYTIKHGIITDKYIVCKDGI